MTEAIEAGVSSLLRVPAELVEVQGQLRSIAVTLATILGRLPGSQLLDTREAAARLGVSPKTVRKLAHAGRLRSVRVGRELRIDVEGMRGSGAGEIATLARQARRA